jgi:hypothetical protein
VSNVSVPAKVITVSVLFAIDCVALFIALTPTNVALPGAAHFKPVASALSATILQEQSQRIVPKAIILA